MAKRWRQTSSAVIVSSAIVVLSGCGGVSSDRVVVQVEGAAPITSKTVDHWMSLMSGVQAVPDPPTYAACVAELSRATQKRTLVSDQQRQAAALKAKCEQMYENLHRRTLAFLISSDWLIAESAHQGLTTNGEEVKHPFEQSSTAPPAHVGNTAEHSATSGWTKSDRLFYGEVTRLLFELRQAVKEKEVLATERMVANYYNHHERRFVAPERRVIEMVRAGTGAAAEEVEREVRSGKSFSRVAKRMSLVHGAWHSAAIAGLERAIFSARPNMLVGPVRSSSAHYVFEVTEIVPARPMSLSLAKERLNPPLLREALTRFINAWRAKWTARTSCRPRYVVQKCRQYVGVRTVEDPLTLD